MNSSRKTASLVLFSLVCLGYLSTPSSAQDTSFTLQQNLHRVQKWLGPGPNGEAWRRYLNLGDLESQTALGVRADIAKLHDILGYFNSDANGLDHPYFVRLRDAIQHQIHAIERANELPDPSSIAISQTFVPITDEQLEAGRIQLLNELKLLKRYYYENLWGIDRPRAMKTLQVNELIALLESVDFLDPENVVEGDDRFTPRQRKILKVARFIRPLKPQYRIYASLQGNFHIQIVEELVQNLDDVCTYAFNDDATKRSYDSNLKDFDTHLAQLGDVRNRAAQLQVSKGLHWMKRLGQHDSFSDAVHQKYSRPNFHLKLTESVINRLAEVPPVQDTRWVDEVVLDNRVQGFAYTSGNVFLDLVHDPYQAHISVNLRGNVYSNGKSDKGILTAYSNSYAQFDARRSLIANVGGLMDFAPYAAANLSSEFCGTSCSLGIVNRIAVNEYLKRKHRSEGIGARRVEENIMQQFTTQTDDAIFEGKDSIANFHAEFFNFVSEANRSRYDVAKLALGDASEPQDVSDRVRLPEGRIYTTDSDLYVSALLEESSRLGALTDPPQYGFPVDVRMQLHESMVNNLIAPYLDGRTYKSSELTAIGEGIMSELPAGMEFDPEEDVEITFETGLPVQVAFEDQRIVARLNVANFKKGDIDTGAMYIQVAVKVIRHQGELLLIPDGDPEVDFQDPGEKTLDQIGIRTQIREQLADARPENPLTNAIDLPRNMIPIDLLQQNNAELDLERARDFRLVQLKSENGWLTIGWSYYPRSAAVHGIMGYPVDTPAIHPYRAATSDGFTGESTDTTQSVASSGDDET